MSVSVRQPIPIIINPASGRPLPVLHILNRVLRAHALSWKALVTHETDDARQFATQAVADGADLVVCYGGDGTVRDVASGLVGSAATLGILPGGTGNSVARILGIPLDLTEATELVCGKHNYQRVSMGKTDNRYFILRAHSGITQEQTATRELKVKHHLLAYLASAVRFAVETPEIHFRIWCDGQETQVTALTCIVNNLGGFGDIHPSLNPTDPASDAFDVLFVSKNLDALTEISSYLVDLGDSPIRAHHLSGREIALEADPPQPIWMDGEYFGQTPVTFQSVPNAVTILVP